MKADELSHLKMTRAEQLLKQCLEQRPDIKEHIPGPEQFAEYIQWMVREFAGRPEYSFSRNAIMAPDYNLAGNRLSEIGVRLIDDPHDTQAIDEISQQYSLHSEDLFFSADCDISVGRMLRYMPGHWHSNDFIEVYYCFSGECPVAFQNETVFLKPGTVLIVAPSVIHASPCYHDDCTLLYYIMRASTFEQVFWKQIPPENLMSNFFRQALNQQQPNSYLQFETGDDQKIRDLLAEIYTEFLNRERFQAQLMNTLMSEFFILLLRRYEGTARLPRTEDFYWKHEYSAILSYIQANYATVKLSDISERFHYNEKQIRRIVQNSTGMSFIQLITKLRMDRALVLLMRENVSAEKIAAEVGYSTASSFYRSFTQFFGSPPGKYLEEKKAAQLPEA